MEKHNTLNEEQNAEFTRLFAICSELFSRHCAQFENEIARHVSCPLAYARKVSLENHRIEVYLKCVGGTYEYFDVYVKPKHFMEEEDRTEGGLNWLRRLAENFNSYYISFDELKRNAAGYNQLVELEENVKQLREQCRKLQEDLKNRDSRDYLSFITRR